MKRPIIWFIIIAFFIGAAGSVFFNRVVFPKLSTVQGFGWVSKLQSSTPLVISRREEVRLNEGVNLIELTKQAQTIVVSVFHPTNQSFLGNGLIVTSDGVIFTTRDVVGANAEVLVQVNDGTVYPGLVRAMDPKSPLAVVTVTAQNLPVAQFSDAGNMQTAQRVFSLGRTNMQFTREFVSGLVTKTLANNTEAGKILSTEVFENTIITDADLDAGYVGGPVVNLQGLIVGMVADGNGLILPAEAIDGAVRTYLEAGKISRPFYGMAYTMITKNNAKVRGIPNGGALINQIAANSPAARSGLQVNDLVLEINGQKVEDSSFEQLLVAQGGNESRLLVRRGEEQIEITLTPEVR